MNEQAAFIRQICEQPEDDTVRLVYADWLDEHGEPVWAEFVRVQVELAKMPPPHREETLMGRGVPLESVGDGYYTMTLDSDDGYVPGERVDVLKHIALKEPKWMRGLRVVKTMPDGYGYFNLVLKRDGESKPWAGTALAARERELFHAINFPILGRDKPIHGLRLTQKELDLCELPSKGLVSRGFVSNVELPANIFPKYAAALFREHPITDVRLTIVSPEQRADADDNPEWGWHRASPDASWVCESEYAYVYPHYLPHDIYDLMDPRAGARIAFPTEQRAWGALSAACIAYARNLPEVALPPLT